MLLNRAGARTRWHACFAATIVGSLQQAGIPHDHEVLGTFSDLVPIEEAANFYENHTTRGSRRGVIPDLKIVPEYDRGHDLLPWGLHRCDLARSADARAIGDAVRATYATDISCFGAVLPSWEQQRRRRLSDLARRLLGNHPPKLGCE